MPKFQKLRISLASDPHTDLLGDQATGPRRSRIEFLQAAFSEPSLFLPSRGKRPIGFDPIPCEAGYVAGFFKRERPLTARREDLHLYNAENYELALFVMSIGKDQVGWMQDNPRFGRPRAVLEAFFQHLASRTDLREWRPEVRYMDSRGEYFEVLARRRRDIAWAKFTFLPPNALGGDDKVRDFVKTVQAQGHPYSQTHLYKAPPGKMNLESEIMEASARVAMEGGGEAELKDRKGRVIYSSEGAITEEDIPEEELPTPENMNFISRVISRLFGAHL